MTASEEVHRHVELLREGLPDALVTCLWAAKGKSSKYSKSAVGAASAAAGVAGDVYVCVASLTEATAKKLGRRRRVSADLAAALSGFALDLDVIGTPDGRGGVKRVGAPSVEAAIEASRLVAEPTLIVASGGGVQPWYLLKEPLIFRSQDEREAAKLACARWQQAHRLASGFAIDATHDLARLMRLAGTRNYKGGGDGVPVKIIADDGPRHAYADLAALVGDVAVDTADGQSTLVSGAPPDERVAQLVEQLCADPDFHSIWEREPDRYEGDDSRYDWQIARRAVRAGLSDDEIRAVCVANRLKHNPRDPKAERADYWALTIGKARSSLRASEYSIKLDAKGKLTLPAVPELGDVVGLCAWLTAAFSLDPAYPITGGEHKGVWGPDGRWDLYRAGARTISFDPAKQVNAPMRLIEALSNQTLPSDGKILPLKGDHCREIALAIRRLCGTSQVISDAQQSAGIVGTFLQAAVAVEGRTSYGRSGQRYEAAMALRRELDGYSGRPMGPPRYLIDANTGEYVIAVSDLQDAARRHIGSSLPRGWLDARMDALGWQRVRLDGHALPGRDGRKGPHALVIAYRGFLASVDDDGSVTK